MLTAAELWDSLATLRRDERIGAATYRCYEYLWLLLDGSPGELLTTVKDLAHTFAKEPRAALKWLDQLIEFGLVEIVSRDNPRPGALRLCVFHPNPERREPRPDSQQPFAFPSDVSARKGPTPAVAAPRTAPSYAPSTAPSSAPKGPIARGQGDTPNPNDNTLACAGAGLSLSSYVVVVDKLDWDQVALRAATLQSILWPKKVNLDNDDKILLWSASSIVGEVISDRWLLNAAKKTAAARDHREIRKTITDHFHGTLVNGLVDVECLTEKKDEARFHFRRLLKQVRPAVVQQLQERKAAEKATPQAPPSDNEGVPAEPATDEEISSHEQRLERQLAARRRKATGANA